MKKLLLVALLIFCTTVSAQKQNNTWCFGNSAGVDFNSGIPVPFVSGMISLENTAAVSDRTTGALLFYTDGMRVWDKNNTLMPNGTGIGNDPGTTTFQGAVIIPFADDPAKYYIFSLEPESVPEGRLYYSVVDMTLRGGLGDVLSTSKKTTLDSGFVEGMLAIPTCDGHWLLLTSKTTNEIYAYKISASGISSQPVVSKMLYPYIIRPLAALKASPDNKKLLYASYSSQTVAGSRYASAVLYDFDERTGKISGGIPLVPPSTTFSFYSCEFSPDGTKAYLCDLSAGQGVLQFNLALPTPTDIAASKRLVYQNPSLPSTRTATCVELAPDGNIYVAITGRDVLDRISNPNAAFPGCVYTQNAIKLSAGTTASQTLPTRVYFADPKNLDTIYSATDATICRGNNTEFNGRQGALKYAWQDGSTSGSFIANDKTTLWVKSDFKCYQAIDTFKISVLNISINIGKDTTICIGQPLTLRVNLKNDSTSYLWFNGSTADSLVADRGGQYSVVVTTGPCELKDTINIKLNDSAYFYIGDDTILCPGEMIQLSAAKRLESRQWSTGSTDSVLNVKQAGTYFLRGKLGRCTYTDTAEIKYAESKFNVGNDTAFCKGAEIVLGDTSIINSQYSWSSGQKGDSLKVSEAGTYILTVNNRCGIFYDTAVINVKICDCDPFIPTAFTPNGDGLNDKMGPVMRCLRFEKYNFIILNRFGQALFTSDDPTIKWDGTFNGIPCDVGTYYYMMKINNTSGTEEFHKGDVILMR